VSAWICAYLQAHPRAADTPEGIQRWWLASQHGEVTLQLVEMALAELEQNGMVQKLDPSALRPAYGRGPALGAGG